MDATQLHELPRDCHRLFARLGLDDGEAADDFLRLGERAVGDGFRPPVSYRTPLLKLSSTNLPIAS